MYKTIDDAISKSYQNLIEDSLTSGHFKWVFKPSITANDVSEDSLTGFSNVILSEGDKSEYAGLLYPVLLEAFDKYQKGVLYKIVLE